MPRIGRRCWKGRFSLGLRSSKGRSLHACGDCKKSEEYQGYHLEAIIGGEPVEGAGESTLLEQRSEVCQQGAAREDEMRALQQKPPGLEGVQGGAEADGVDGQEELRATAATKCSKRASRQLSRDEVKRGEQAALQKV